MTTLESKELKNFFYTGSHILNIFIKRSALIRRSIVPNAVPFTQFSLLSGSLFFDQMLFKICFLGPKFKFGRLGFSRDQIHKHFIFFVTFECAQ